MAVRCVEGNSEWKKQHALPNLAQNEPECRIQTVLQFPVTPPPIPRTSENATFADFMKKSM